MTDTLPGMPSGDPEKLAKTVAGKPSKPLERAFGAENRARLLDEYFGNRHTLLTADAWKDIYRLLLSIDRTIGLAHCYESDKCQPGKAWYRRSLAFHAWVAEQLDTTPDQLADKIDWLFRRAIVDLANIQLAATHTKRVLEERAPYEGLGMPEPGDDPELISIINETLGPWLRETPTQDVERQLTQRVMAYVRQENKRRNLIGEAFEDTIASVLRRLPGFNDLYSAQARVPLENVRGFRAGSASQKKKVVDLVLIHKHTNRRILVSAKWSVRADREAQFDTDFIDYLHREIDDEDFDHVWVTNEFDAARLVRACERRHGNGLMFTDVVHVQPKAPALTYEGGRLDSDYKSKDMYKHIDSGRLASFQSWAEKLLGV